MRCDSFVSSVFLRLGAAEVTLPRLREAAPTDFTGRVEGHTKRYSDKRVR